MSLLSVRQKLVSSNIANADTPGYRTQDIDFRAEFARSAFDSTPKVIEPQGLTPKADGNNVSLDRESRLLSETAIRFAVATNLARSEMQSIRVAMDEGKSS